MRVLLSLLFTLSLVVSALIYAATSDQTPWQTVLSSDGSTAEPRHESGAVNVGGKLYLLGGRGNRNVQVYDPALAVWTNLGPTPMEMHHFQPVAVGNLIYVVGGFTCCYPNEDLLTDIHVFDTQTATWSVIGGMPASRNRGSAAAFVRNGLIYVLGGNTQGHSGGAVGWFDEFDPATGEWKVLADAPNARDHFSAVLVNDMLVAAAGRQTNQPNPFDNAVLQTDLYDFLSNEWQSTTAIPTPRAGVLAGAAGDEIIVAGGEINTSADSLDTVEAFNIYSQTWRSLQPLTLGRHSGGGAVVAGSLHVLAGSLKTGGAPETGAHEALLLDEISSIDFDADGLDNNEERAIHGTHPGRADTDFDGLSDKDELTVHNTDPLESDTDDDGIADGKELNDWGTSPLQPDTDADGLSDFDEVFNYTSDANKADTDNDGLSDSEEVFVYNTDPTNTDTDNDGLPDGSDPDPLNGSGVDDSGTTTADGGSTTGNTAGTTGGDTSGSNDAGNTSTGDAGSTTGNTQGSSGGGGAIWLFFALVVGSLSRFNLKRVNEMSNKSYS